MDPTLTAAWREPHRVSEVSDLSSTYKRFHVAQDVSRTKHNPVHVCVISWRLSKTKLSRGIGLGVFFSILVGCVSGVLSGDYSKGLDIMQTLIDVLAILLSLALLVMKYQL